MNSKVDWHRIANEQRIEIIRLEDALAAWRELADHVRLGMCASIWPGRYRDATTHDVAHALRDYARNSRYFQKMEVSSTDHRRVIPPEVIESAAESIYNVMQCDGDKPAWVSGGNSFKQDDARNYARVVLGMVP